MDSSSLSIFLTVALAHMLAVASPGPDFAVVVRQSLAFGRSAGLWTAFGIGCGISFHVAYGLFGLNWATERWPFLLDALGWAGAAFLIWMGQGALRAQPGGADPATAAQARAGGWRRDWLIGLATNVLNPKAMMFFVALFSAVVTGPVAPELRWLLGLWLPLTTFAWFALVATLLSDPRLREPLQERAWLIDRVMGVVLLGLAGLMVVHLLGG